MISVSDARPTGQLESGQQFEAEFAQLVASEPPNDPLIAWEAEANRSLNSAREIADQLRAVGGMQANHYASRLENEIVNFTNILQEAREETPIGAPLFLTGNRHEEAFNKLRDAMYDATYFLENGSAPPPFQRY